MERARVEELRLTLKSANDSCLGSDCIYSCPLSPPASFLIPSSSGSCTDSNDGHPSVKANLKAVQGVLFMLEKCVFVSKHPVFIDLVDIHQVVFSRLGQGMGASAARSFELKITTKGGPEYVFSSIMKEDKNGVEAC